MKKNIVKYFSLFCISLSLSACSDFFNPDTDAILEEDQYINEESEMYAGFLGIITKLQAVADKSIYIFEPRAEFVEVTTNAPSELYALYNYDENLSGNSYADPAPYYDMIIACNDYLLRMVEYKKNVPAHSINNTHYEALISSAVRQKVWAYLNLAKIYGEAIWFDEPLMEYTDMSQYPLLDFDQIIDACLNLLDNGFNGISSDLGMKWEEYIDPTAQGSSGDYYYWEAQTPAAYILYAELYLWKATGVSGEARIDYYQKSLDLTLTTINESIAGSNSQSRTFLRNQDWLGKVAQFWGGKEAYRPETISAVLYNYSQNQTNKLKKHFEKSDPNQYMLAPSKVGMERYTEGDKRISSTFRDQTSSSPYVKKFTGGREDGLAYQDDNFVITYRGSEMYFMLMEALNGVGRYEEVEVLMNAGIGGTFLGALANDPDPVPYEGFTDWWCSYLPNGSYTQYPSLGVRSCWDVEYREMSVNAYDANGNLVEAADPRINDEALLDEMMLEFAAEGKTYPAMIRMARKYRNASGEYDLSLITDRVCPKYDNPDAIRAKIDAGGYFIKWDYGF